MAGTALILCEVAGGKVRGASLPAITFGRKVAEAQGGNVTLLLIGNNLGEAPSDAARFATRVVVVEDAQLEPYMAETWAPVVAQVAKNEGAAMVGATATSVGKDLLPRVAALLDVGMASDVSAVEGPRKYRRAMNAGNVVGHVEVLTPVHVATCRQTEFPAAHAEGASGEIVKAAAGAVSTLGAEHLGVSAQKSARPELTEARVVVSGGRGMREGANFKILEELTDLLGGAMGASRAACDAGMVPNDLQVGQTGKVVAPELYIAVAISGAIQHLAGMKGSKTIVAVNKDPEAPIFQVADYGLVSTWEKAVPELIAEVKKLKASQG
jgi:electron transfer flavoprotein alpha subunit